jgi:TyrR family helix-turn-helix protein
MSESDILDESLFTVLGGGHNTLNTSSQESCNLPARVREFEKGLLENAMLRCKSTREMAEYLGINQSTVVRKLKKYRLSRQMMQNSIA